MRESRSLNGPWRYTPLAHVTINGAGEWVADTNGLPAGGEMCLPAHWERAGLTGFAGTVRFERAFDAPTLRPGESLWLLCRGVDYVATVRVNGHPVGTHEGYFQTRELDLTPYVRQGENTLAIDVTCPREEPGAAWPDNKRTIKGILSHWDCRPGSWDPATGQDVHSGGIWNDVILETRPAVYIARSDVQTWLTPPNEALSQDLGRHDDAVPTAQVARVMVTTTLAASGPTGAAEEPLWLEVQVGEHSVRSPVELSAGHVATVESVLTIPAPRLWWTWDHGEPYLYPFTVRLCRGEQLIDQCERQIGIRELSLDPETGTWTLNGRRIFVRGTNIVPTLWLGEYDQQAIDADVALLKAAHVNGVRVCVHVNREELYDALDRAGILVWQDFALQWGYQQSDAFIAEAVRQVKDMVRLLRHHPCIALWCCQNESTQFNRAVLDPLLARAAQEEDSSRYVRPTSEFSEHLYHGWYRGDPRDYLAPPTAAIISEFGAQALPSAEEMRAMVGTAWPPDWRAMAYHDFQYDQTFHVARIALGENWEEFVANSQEYQAALLKMAIERFRRAKYAPVGGLFQFMFMDCWPSVTWSVLSCARRPKAGYAALQCAYQPVLVGALLERETWIAYTDLGSHVRATSVVPWVVNDRAVPYPDAQLSLALRDETAGREAELAEVRCDVPADGVVTLPRTRTPLALPDGWADGDYTLCLRLRAGDDLLSNNQYRIRLIARNPALATESAPAAPPSHADAMPRTATPGASTGTPERR